MNWPAARKGSRSGKRLAQQQGGSYEKICDIIDHDAGGRRPGQHRLRLDRHNLRQNVDVERIRPSAPRAGVRADAPLPALVVTDATGSAALESEKMFYRLNYADPMQARAYANSRWNTNPLELVTERLKTRLAQAGSKVLEPTDAATSVPILRVQVDDFMHTFASASQSSGAKAR